MKKPKILMLFCGGTISMHKNEQSGALTLSAVDDQFSRLEPRIHELADIDLRFIDNIDSTNMAAAHWERLGSEIAGAYDDYDGFLITMGTNTLAYASSALSFSLADIGKPVILTGAQIPAESISTDARNNIVNSLRVAAMNLGGVFVVFGSRIILGSRAKKVSESELDAFRSFNNKDFGEILIGIKINDDSRPGHNLPLLLKNGFEDNILCLTLIPGLRPDYVAGLMESGVRGFILRAYGSGDIPSDFLPVLQQAKEKEIPVVVTTQCPGGATVMGLNEVGLNALQTGVIQAFDMSMEAMSTKLMWMLKQNLPYNELRAEMHRNLCGEVDAKRVQVFLNQELRNFYETTGQL